MAAETASPLPSNTIPSQPTKITSIKTLAESPGLTSIPATHAFTPDLHGQSLSGLGLLHGDQSWGTTETSQLDT
ncbi:hypothetical protein OIU85_007164 [Salix viminalis]|uniref:Uncharacterized protein n=1 Tax=Salix viminalis TaxID=40686 RepID=A0A9Q0SNM1_SALVM|nr:hypothetical protein OIU85_007164 [Salix viminalis]